MPTSAAHQVIPKRCSLYKQPRSDRWYARIKLNDGSWYRVATGETDLESARDKALELYTEAKIKADNNLPQNSRSFSSIAKSVLTYIEDSKDTSDWKQTYKYYAYPIKKYQIPYFGNTKIDNIRNKYEGYIEYVQKEIGKSVKQSTIATHHAALRLILDRAVEHGWANTNTLPKLKAVGGKSERRPTFDASEYRSMIQKLRHWVKRPTHRKKDAEIKLLLYDYVLFLANSGVRHGREAMDIKWRNISFKKTAKGNNSVTIMVTKKKGRKGTIDQREVIVRHNDISDFKKVLTRLKDRIPTLKKLKLETVIKRRLDCPVFCLNDGTQPTSLAGTFKKFLIDADLLIGAEGKARTLYSLRHFYATQALLADPPISIYLLAKQLGTSVPMIDEHYGHLETFQKADYLSGWKEFE